MFIVFPVSTPFGLGGVGLGALTPVFVLIFNTIGWGIPAYAWFRLAGEHAGRRMCNTILPQRSGAQLSFLYKLLNDSAA